METLLIYLLLGAFVGVIAGLLGVGGGLIIVPILVLVFRGMQVPETVLMHLAIGTSLATIIVTSLSSTLAHHRRGAVDWLVFRHLAPSIGFGALAGAIIVDQLPSDVLRVTFGVFELLVALQMVFNLGVSPHRRLPGIVGIGAIGIVIGIVSSAMGIGGGVLTTPFLVWCNVSIRRAIATSSACGLPIAVGGAMGFVVTGWNEPELPAWSSGYVYWPGFAGIALASVMFAPHGAKLTHTLPMAIVRKIFSVFLAVLGVRMLIG